MDTAMVIDLSRQALWTAMLVCAPLLLVALAVGLFIGIIQAATSINESTLSFIPKLIVLVIGTSNDSSHTSLLYLVVTIETNH